MVVVTARPAGIGAAVPVVIALPVGFPIDEEESVSRSFAQEKPAGWDAQVVVAESVSIPMGEAVVDGQLVNADSAAAAMPAAARTPPVPLEMEREPVEAPPAGPDVLAAREELAAARTELTSAADLELLVKMRAEGDLSEDEFERAKERIFGGSSGAGRHD